MRTSFDNCESDRQDWRARFERKYPLPPGVVIKSEPVTFGYPTDTDATLMSDDMPDDNGFLNALTSPSSPAPVTAAVNSASNGVTSSTSLQALGPAGSSPTSVGASVAGVDRADSSAVAGTGPGEHPVGRECVDPPMDLQDADTTASPGCSGPPLDLDCPDLDIECEGDGAVYDEPPVLTPVSPLSPRGQDNNADFSDARETIFTGHARASTARARLPSAKSRNRPRSRKKRMTSSGTESDTSSSQSVKSRPEPKRLTESSDQRESMNAPTASIVGAEKRQESASLPSQNSSDAIASSLTSLFASSASMVSAAPSTSSQYQVTSSSASNDRIRRLKEMLKKQNEQLEEILSLIHI